MMPDLELACRCLALSAEGPRSMCPLHSIRSLDYGEEA
jgi:hypothetical protein